MKTILVCIIGLTLVLIAAQCIFSAQEDAARRMNSSAHNPSITYNQPCYEDSRPIAYTCIVVEDFR